MGKFRVLYNDGQDDASGRWQDVDAETVADATWQAAVAAGTNSRFLAVAPLDQAALSDAPGGVSPV